MAKFDFLKPPAQSPQPTPEYTGRPTYPDAKQTSASKATSANFNQDIKLPNAQGGVDSLNLSQNQAELDALALTQQITPPSLEDLPASLAEVRALQASQMEALREEIRREVMAQFKEQLRPQNVVEQTRRSAASGLRNFLGEIRAGYAKNRDRANDGLKNKLERGKQVLKNFWTGLTKRSKQAVQVTGAAVAAPFVATVVAGKAGYDVAQKTKERVVSKTKESYQNVAEKVRQVSWDLANKKFEIIGGLEHGVNRYVRLEHEIQVVNEAIKSVKSNMEAAAKELYTLHIDEVDDAEQAQEIEFIQLRQAEYSKEFTATLRQKQEIEAKIKALDLQAKIDQAKQLYDKIEQNNPGYLQSAEGQNSKLVRVMQEAIRLLNQVNANQTEAALRQVNQTTPVVSAAELASENTFAFQDLEGNEVSPIKSTPDSQSVEKESGEAPETSSDTTSETYLSDWDEEESSDEWEDETKSETVSVVEEAPSPEPAAVLSDWNEEGNSSDEWEEEDLEQNASVEELPEDEDEDLNWEPVADEDPTLGDLVAQTNAVPEAKEALKVETIAARDFNKERRLVNPGDTLVISYRDKENTQNSTLRLTQDANGAFQTDQSFSQVQEQEVAEQENGAVVTKRYLFLRQDPQSPLITIRFGLHEDILKTEAVTVEATSEMEASIDLQKAAVETASPTIEALANEPAQLEVVELDYDSEPVTLEHGKIYEPVLEDGDMLRLTHPEHPVILFSAISGGRLDPKSLASLDFEERRDETGEIVQTYVVPESAQNPELYLEVRGEKLIGVEVGATAELSDWEIDVR